MFGLKALKCVVAAGAMALMAHAAQAVTVNFERITANSPTDASAQLSLEVTDDGTRALFSFTVLNGSQNGASIAEIYFSDLLALFMPPPSIETETGVDYIVGSVNPGLLPSGNNASPPFVVTSGLVADNEPGNANAIQIGDLLVLGLNYSAGVTFQDLLDGLAANTFRVGLHVRSLDRNQSDSFVSVPDVPVPAAGFLLIGALGGLAALRRRRVLA